MKTIKKLKILRKISRYKPIFQEHKILRYIINNIQDKTGKAKFNELLKKL